MERFFIFDKFNTWYDWHSIITDKEIPDAEPKTNYVKLDGMNGTLDLSEALTGEITYDDRTISATFWTDFGTRKDREALLREITASLHGKKVKIIEPDDPTHYFYGRVKIKSKKNILPYAEFTIEATCEPWRYATDEIVRKIDVYSPEAVDLIINNDGDKTVTPIIKVLGNISLTYNGAKTNLIGGEYKISDIKLYRGVNIIGLSGDGAVAFTYREANL